MSDPRIRNHSLCGRFSGSYPTGACLNVLDTIFDPQPRVGKGSFSKFITSKKFCGFSEALFWFISCDNALSKGETFSIQN